MNFKSTAAQHQKEFFKSEDTQDSTNVSRPRAQLHWLNETGASKGLNFYSGYSVFEEAKKRRGSKRDTPEWFLDTLRSQHIPFNFFIPLVKETELAKNLFNKLYNLNITSIDSIHIEFPSNRENPLKDHTSFDAFVDYKSNDKKGFIAFEVKYTESGYSPSEKELEWIREASSTYSTVTNNSKIFLEEKVPLLKNNSYRQIWRNHLLAIEWARVHKYDEFLFVTLYPEGNEYIGNSLRKYLEFLVLGTASLVSTTYEKFLDIASALAIGDDQKQWIGYMQKRYTMKNEI